MEIPFNQDPLLACLLFVAKKADIQCTPTSLLAGLPLIDGKLTPELALRSCQRMGRNGKVVQRRLEDIPPQVYPCLLLLNENQSAVLLSRNSSDQSLQVYFSCGEIKNLSLDELNGIYTGYAIFLSQQSDDVENLHALHGGSPDLKEGGEWFWSTLSLSWRIYRDVLIASFFINLFALAMPLFVMNVYDRVVPNSAIETLWVLALGVMLVAVFDFILRNLRVYFIEVAGKKSDILLSSFIFSKLLGARFSELPRSSGIYANQLREFESVRSFITSAVITSVVDLPFCLLFLVVIAYIAGGLVWIPIIAAPVLLTYAWFVQRRLSKMVDRSLHSAANKNATLVESLAGMETLKSLGAEGRVLRRWETAVSSLAFWGLKSRVLSSSATNVALMCTQLASVAVVVSGVYAISEKQLTMGALVACVLLVGRCLSPLANISNLLVQYQHAKLAFGSISEIVHKAQERPPERRFIQRDNFDGEIEFKNVSFTYPEEKISTLCNINLRVKKGERVALIGKLGSGKSSLQRLIAGLYQPSSGSVLLDGTDIAQIDPADIRSKLSFVPQDSYLFTGSIRENIAYRNHRVEDRAISEAANVAGVKLFTDTHPMGLERQVGERGRALSGGQRQAVCLARALIGQPSILLLDEPTSAMDSSSEAWVLDKLRKFIDGKTLIIVTHRSSLLALVDRVIVLDEGKIVADGPRDFVVESLKKGQLRAV